MESVKHRRRRLLSHQRDIVLWETGIQVRAPSDWKPARDTIYSTASGLADTFSISCPLSILQHYPCHQSTIPYCPSTSNLYMCLHRHFARILQAEDRLPILGWFSTLCAHLCRGKMPGEEEVQAAKGDIRSESIHCSQENMISYTFRTPGRPIEAGPARMRASECQPAPLLAAPVSDAEAVPCFLSVFGLLPLLLSFDSFCPFNISFLTR